MCRRVGLFPNVTYYKPAGVRKFSLEEVVLGVDEYEAVRLKDVKGLEQSQAAEQMHVSQPTFHRILLDARRKIADAIVHGKVLRIEGGVYDLVTKPGVGRVRRRERM